MNRLRPHEKDIVPPIHRATTFELDEATVRALQSGESRHDLVYTRHGNPTLWRLEEEIAALEGAEGALVFASGMAAISTTLLTFLRAGDRLVSTHDLYGGSDALLREQLPRFGIEVVRVDPTDADAISAATTPNTRVFFFETVSNPLMKVVDVPRLVEMAQSVDAIIMLDNTFLTPVNFRPLEHGVDLVVHSATKYLSGHSDVIAGCVAGSKSLLDAIWSTLTQLGGCLDPGAAALVSRGLPTLSLRMARHQENATAVASLLREHPAVERVLYSGSPTHPQHARAQALFDGHGGMVCFSLHGGEEAAVQFIAALPVGRHAVSLGSVETLVCQPWNSTHAAMPEKDRQSLGIVPGLVRMSVGIEDTDLLLDGLRHTLDALPAAAAALTR